MKSKKAEKSRNNNGTNFQVYEANLQGNRLFRYNEAELEKGELFPLLIYMNIFVHISIRNYIF